MAEVEMIEGVPEAGAKVGSNQPDRQQEPVNLYPRNSAPTLDPDLFHHPTAEYRGTPFWAWNTLLRRDQLLRQIDQLQEAGFGGFHIHARTGLATPYLGEEFMAHVQACAERARALGMLCWLYDEDRWPSGFAGGLVTREPRFRAKHLLFTPTPYGGSIDPTPQTSGALGARTENGALLGRYHVVLHDDYLHSYRRLAADDGSPSTGRIWYVYLETAVPSPWWNNQTYVDTLDREAIERFIAVTHERYAAILGDAFGTLVPAIFTDEPQFVHKQSLQRAADARDLCIPWTTDFAGTYQAACGTDILDALPELFWELPDRRVSHARYFYHDHLAERFAHAFADTLGAWCGAHGIALTGHMMEEPTLQSQTAALGEAMRSYRAFHLPGIDMLCDEHEYTTAKQAQSAAHQYGRPGVLSELYGVTNWDFDFAGHKAQGDWQAALGVTVRVPHLSWVSMAGEAKRDYPASIHYQSPWYREYPLIEDHFARLNTVLTRGSPRVRVAVIHPIESYWLCFGPLDQTGVEREEREAAFADLTNWLLFGLIDFDFIAESLLPSLCSPAEADCPRLPVGAMRYDVVIVPGMRTIRSSTLDRLERFAAAGGMVLFTGEVPSLVDARQSDRGIALAARCRQIAHARAQVLQALEPWREVEVQLADGLPADTILHQLRDDGDRRILFLCNPQRRRSYEATRVALRGRWQVTLFDTLRGESRALDAGIQLGWTTFVWDFPAQSSLLLYLDPLQQAHDSPSLPLASAGTRPAWITQSLLRDPVPVTLSEPNVLLLDQAAYRLNDEAWQPEEEVLRIDNVLRTRLGWPLKMDALAQPWTETEIAAPSSTLSLRFIILCDVPVAAPSLALENAEHVTVSLDGKVVPSLVTGWFVDEAIATIALPPITSGRHELILSIPYGRLTNIEWCYLLGDFGVMVRGKYARIIQPVRDLAFGDWTRQGLPFYAGNVTYHCTFAGADRRLALHTPAFKAPLIAVFLDGRAAGHIAFAPYRLDLGQPSSGPHALDLTVYGNRVNAFGPIHNADPDWTWFGPNAWRTTGDQWAYQYQLKPTGLLVAPQVQVFDEEQDASGI